MNVLMICLGNICRSPLAEELLREKVGESILVDSCGTSNYHEGSAPDKRSIAVAAKYGIDIALQKSRPLRERDFEIFDLLLCMDRSVLESVKKSAPQSFDQNKIQLFLEFAEVNKHNFEVPDPYFGGEDGFEHCYSLINEATANIAKKLC